MNRRDLQTLADLRVTDGEKLVDAGRFSAAYYLLGYAVECALKACIAKQIRGNTTFLISSSFSIVIPITLSSFYESRVSSLSSIRESRPTNPSR
jgi:hypothetical protein